MLFCRHKQFVTRDGQIGIGISMCQPQDKPLTSSDEQYLDTVSYLKSPSPAPFAGSSVDSVAEGFTTLKTKSL